MTDSVKIKLPPHDPIALTLSAADDRIVLSHWLRLWGLMHKYLTHNKTYPTYREFAEATLTSLREKVPKNWLEFCDSISDNCRLINPKDFRVLA